MNILGAKELLYGTYYQYINDKLSNYTFNDEDKISRYLDELFSRNTLNTSFFDKSLTYFKRKLFEVTPNIESSEIDFKKFKDFVLSLKNEFKKGSEEEFYFFLLGIPLFK